MSETNRGPTPPQTICFVLADLLINGAPPLGRADQPAVLVIKEVRKVVHTGGPLLQNVSPAAENTHVLVVDKGSTELVSASHIDRS